MADHVTVKRRDFKRRSRIRASCDVCGQYLETTVWIGEDSELVAWFRIGHIHEGADA